MASDPSRALRAILILGGIAFVFLWISSFGLRKTMEADESQRVAVGKPHSEFNAELAMKQVEAIAALGPRPPGSPSLNRACDDFISKMRANGLSVTDDRSPTGTVPPNVRARCKGNLPGVIVLMARLSSHPSSAEAIASASGSGLLLELARTIGSNRRGMSLDFVWYLETGEASSPDSPMKSWFDELSPKAVFVIEAPGDCYLEVASDPDAPIWMRGVITDTTEQFGYARHFPTDSVHGKDFLLLRPADYPVLYLVDAIAGGSIARHASIHETAEDSMD